jgi:Flp pilus assembly pilin Flp
MKSFWKRIQAFHADQCGATTLEYTALLAILVVAFFPLVMKVLDVLQAHYQMIVYLIGLPFI